MALRYRPLIFAAAGAATFAIWFILWSVIAQDQCLDSGGALRPMEFACVLPDGRIVPLIFVVRPAVTLVLVAAVVTPVLFAVRVVVRRLKR